MEGRRASIAARKANMEIKRQSLLASAAALGQPAPPPPPKEARNRRRSRSTSSESGSESSSSAADSYDFKGEPRSLDVLRARSSSPEQGVLVERPRGPRKRYAHRFRPLSAPS